MNPVLDPANTGTRHDISESLALANWYQSNPVVRRLQGIQVAQALRVVISIEPSFDSDDVYPAWVANCQQWARELNALTGQIVQLELVGAFPLDGMEFRAGRDIVADLFWRDATLDPSHEVSGCDIDDRSPAQV